MCVESGLEPTKPYIHLITFTGNKRLSVQSTGISSKSNVNYIVMGIFHCNVSPRTADEKEGEWWERGTDYLQLYGSKQFSP